jgi:hypothetical protein
MDSNGIEPERLSPDAGDLRFGFVAWCGITCRRRSVPQARRARDRDSPLQ